ncbi:hypothetical protein LSH36_360g02036 [Paralvinella palmiformis]|uniref:ADF-H domain-containing protein n=1 Tax=Paralvinella palmiformis TaxID=53620 RepID=A0AAD9MZU9_9ANNE|nr:hypothetical protein LSH36_360g02036 [Paralvinella palmiformis]
MSHQTGITASDDLRSFFAAAKEGQVRTIKVSIKNEQLMLDDCKNAEGSWQDDWDKTVLPLLEEAQPCYILYRLDSRESTGYQWVYMSYSPDYSPHELSLRGYQKHVSSQKAPAPLTNAEEELEEIKKNETQVDISVDSKHQTMQGVAFPISQEAMDKLNQLKHGSPNYVQLKIDLDQERILLASFDNTDIHHLSSRIPKDHARYHFFIYKHSHEGDFLESIVFIYSMPGYSCPIKERMLYSSCKSPLLSMVEDHIGLQVVRRIEVDNPSEVTEQFLYEEVHPKVTIVKQQFAKPKGPAGRGPKRLTRPTQAAEK